MQQEHNLIEGVTDRADKKLLTHKRCESGGTKQIIRNVNVSPKLEDQQLLNYCILDFHGIKVKTNGSCKITDHFRFGSQFINCNVT